MKNVLLGAAALAIASTATPAFAQAENFEGLRAGVLAGVTGDKSPFDETEFTYGGVIGYDYAVSKNFLVGVEADIAASEIDDLVDSRQISVALRGTYPVSAKGALFVSGGYSNLRLEALGVSEDFDGFRLGAGGEYKITDRFYTSLEYRYSEYDLGPVNEGVQSVLVGAGIRF